MTGFRFLSRSVSGAAAAATGIAVLAAMAACDPTFGLGLPSTRALESGAGGSLTSAPSFEIQGSYKDSGEQWSIDLQVTRPATEHVTLMSSTVSLEGIILSDAAYFRGQQFLTQHMGSDPFSQNLAKAAGNAWWKGSPGTVPRLVDLMDGDSFRTAFLGPVVTKRTDHVSVDGIDAAEMSGARADVFISEQAPYHLLRIRMKKGVVVDSIAEGDLRYGKFGQDFQIAAPGDVIDFSNLSTLPPVYTVVSVDTSGCASPCAVSAVVKNLGGLTGATSPSTITFTMTEATSGKVLGSCKTQVAPDVAYNATTTVGCTISGLNGQPPNAAVVTAAADNPGHA